MYNHNNIKSFLGRLPFLSFVTVNDGSPKTPSKKAISSVGLGASANLFHDQLEKRDRGKIFFRISKNFLAGVFSAKVKQNHKEKGQVEAAFVEPLQNHAGAKQYFERQAFLDGLGRENLWGIDYLEEPPPLRHENGELVELIEFTSWHDIVRSMCTRMPPGSSQEDFEISESITQEQ